MGVWISVLVTLLLPVASAALDTWLYMGSLQGEAEWVWPDLWRVMLFDLVKWLVVWAGGVWLLLTGARQALQPGLALKQAYGADQPPSERAVRDLGFACIAIGVLCLASLAKPQLTMAGAIAAGMFFGLSGLGKLTGRAGRGGGTSLALWSELWVFAALAAGVAVSLSTRGAL